MLGCYPTRRTDLSRLILPAALLLPLTLVVVVLTLLNLEQAVFDVMAGLREEGTANDTVYGVLVGISMFSIFAAPALLCVYGIAVWHRWRAAAAQ